jgi:hypothetical protein
MRLLLVTALVAFPASAPAAGDVAPANTTALRASTHPMRYHLALPSGWKADRTWPVLVVIPDAGREFEANLASFVKARGNRPYILVAPEVLSCGGAGSRTAEHYSYTVAEWDSLQRGDDFAFEDGGLEAVLGDTGAGMARRKRSSPAGRRAATRCGRRRCGTRSGGAAWRRSPRTISAGAWTRRRSRALPSGRASRSSRFAAALPGATWAGR